MTSKKEKVEERHFHKELIKEFITLSTSAFGFIAALAWNEVVQTFVSDYVQRWFPSQSDVISKLIYAIIITALGVLITYQLSRLASYWGNTSKN